jgi:hypothetical protein
MRRSRKPAWAVSSIEGSNPSLSATAAKRQHLLGNRMLRHTVQLIRRGSTEASLGRLPRVFVPSAVPSARPHTRDRRGVSDPLHPSQRWRVSALACSASRALPPWR